MYRYICSVVSFASMKILMHACSTMAKRKFVPHGFHTPDVLASHSENASAHSCMHDTDVYA